MRLIVQKLFEKDIRQITEKKIAGQVMQALETMEACKQLSELRNVKKMFAKGNYYRMRIGNYRLGFKVENDTLVLLRFMHRKDIYSYFP